jgi:hypothetical protein
MTARYTFGICSRCGVVSPPIVVTGHSAWSVAIGSLIQQGWKYQDLKFNIIAVCPACLDAEENSDSAA